jgi:hypothetical protein
VYNWKTEKNAAKNYYFLLHNMYDLGQSGTVMEYCFKGRGNFTKGFSRKKIHGGGGTPSIIWGTITRILIIFGVPPRK